MSQTGDGADDGTADAPRRPPMAPDVARVESAVQQAISRGDFDDLPGAGKPLDLPGTHDPDWWIKQRLEEGDIDRDALLPPVVLLRREHDRIEETLAELPDQQMVREYVEDYNERVRTDRAANPLARMLAPELSPDEVLTRWRQLRAGSGRWAPAPAPSQPPTGRRRRWLRWPLRRRDHRDRPRRSER